MDELIKKYALELEKIYAQQTAGCYTFEGCCKNLPNWCYLTKNKKIQWPKKLLRIRCVLPIIGSAIKYGQAETRDEQIYMGFWEDSIQYWVHEMTKES